VNGSGKTGSGGPERAGDQSPGTGASLPGDLGARVAYPRIARWTVAGAALFLSSGVVNLLSAAVAEVFVVVAFAMKYLGASLFAMGAFFYALYWSVDYGPDFVRRLRG